MIWCIIGITLFILAFVFNKLGNVCHDKTYDKASDAFEGLCIGSALISIIITATCSTLIVIANTCEKFEVEEAKSQRSVYVILLEENKDVTIQNQLYKDIVKYNSRLRKNKHYRKSPWTNWFYAKGWNELEYIEINNYNTQEE